MHKNCIAVKKCNHRICLEPLAEPIIFSLTVIIEGNLGFVQEELLFGSLGSMTCLASRRRGLGNPDARGLGLRWNDSASAKLWSRQDRSLLV